MLAAFLSAPSLLPAADDEGLAFFEQKIRPVLVQRCYACHSAEAKTAKKLQGGLYLDTAAGWRTGGETGPAIVPGKSAESLLLKALRHDGLEMPPDGRLAPEVIADFAKWIDRGAPDPRQGDAPVRQARTIDLDAGRQWWSFRPLREVPLPAVPNGPLVHGPIDRFVVAAQVAGGVKQNVPASKEKLIRRAYFDLLGLPPTPEQIDAFVGDASPGAFEKVVDQLLQSPHYGEKWARHWLDATRFAESNGYEFDAFRPGAYHYRDWVIRALNDDLPYDEFLRLQLAGDKLRPDEYAGAAATGFLVAGPYPGQITAKTVERIRYDQIDDMLMTVGGSMLGLTIGCVRCHEHKYDPIPHQDYYALAASLARTVQGTRSLDPDPTATEKAIAAHRAQLDDKAAALRAFAQDELPKRFETWRTAELPKQRETPRWQAFEPTHAEAEKSRLKWLADGIVAHDGPLDPQVKPAPRGRGRGANPKQPPAGADEYRLTLRTFQKNVAALRIDAFADKALPQRGPGVNGDGSFQLAEVRVSARPLDPQVKSEPVDLKLKPVLVAFADDKQPLEHAVDGKSDTAWVVKATAKKDNAAVFELDPPLAGFAGGTELSVELEFKDQGIGRLRLGFSTEPNPATWAGDVLGQHVTEIRTILAANANKVPDALREPLVQWFAPFDPRTNEVWTALRDHPTREPRAQRVEIYTTVAGGQDVYHLRRGEVDNKLAKAEPGFLQVLLRGEPAAPANGTTSASSKPAPTVSVDPRVALAANITDVEHGAGPLVARVIVNRVWQHHFGRGLVRTSNDFGAQGERPTHPELLEWLATDFVQGGWKLKRLHKAILLSATWQQSHAVVAENLKRDPENRLLWHHPPRRLEAEPLRDALLAVGGNLDPKMHGPSVLADSMRRSVYLRVKRSELIPMMTMFDAPEPTQSIGERVGTTVPTQALTLMNSPFVRQQAERLAQRVRNSPADSAEVLIDRAWRIALGRRPTDSERTRTTAFLEAPVETASGAQTAPDKGPLLTEICHALLCLNEFAYID